MKLPGLNNDRTKKFMHSPNSRGDEYKYDNPKAGIALIFNHKKFKSHASRLGTEKDRDGLKRTLLMYGFDVRVYNDLTAKELYDVLNSVAQEDHSSNDCLIVAVMSHGKKGQVCARDTAYPVENLWEPFLSENCKTLITKPKLFFIQACRGPKLDEPVTAFSLDSVRQTSSISVISRIRRKLKRRYYIYEEFTPTLTYVTPTTADMLIMYSTFEEHCSFRNVKNGSWFIQSLCAVLDHAAANAVPSEQGAELLSLLTAVNRKVAYEYESKSMCEPLNQMKSMPNYLSTLTKTFYLRVKPKQKKNWFKRCLL